MFGNKKKLSAEQTREAIFKCDDMVTKELYIPEWDITVYVRSVTAAERDELEGRFLDQREDKKKKALRFRSMWAIACTVDKDGNRIFKDGDVDTLGNKSGKAVGRIFNMAQELSGMTDKDVEELEKNSGETTSDDSSSDSPGT